ncbi:hypothetical protein GCM10011571_32550 [Marinithermofilum abyssi]|uniref:Uncharacterized protein n=1 Tax=Marinithermofilum abyssi TaxID=1571185 RepID=A0A8J2Y9Y6_9BACL|nr:hypothetical protein GCM10011571_32550 [Marinithermofilum abyssi]
MSSTGKRRQQKTPNGGFPSEEAVNTRGTKEAPSWPAARTGHSSAQSNTDNLLEKILNRDNLVQAYRRVVPTEARPVWTAWT